MEKRSLQKLFSNHLWFIRVFLYLFENYWDASPGVVSIQLARYLKVWWYHGEVIRPWNKKHLGLAEDFSVAVAVLEGVARDPGCFISRYLQICISIPDAPCMDYIPKGEKLATLKGKVQKYSLHGLFGYVLDLANWNENGCLFHVCCRDRFWL